MGRGSGSLRANFVRDQFVHANFGGGYRVADDLAKDAKMGLATGKGTFSPKIPWAPSSGPHGNTAADTADLVLRQGALGSMKPGTQTAGSLAKLAVSPRRWGASGLGQSLEPLSIKGVGGAEKDLLPAVAAGRTAGTKVEDFFRGALYNSQVRKGFSPEMAADTVNKMHFNYDALTGFEKNAMRRVFPLYCVPADHEILTQGGWKNYRNLDIGEPVMSYEVETGEMTWVPLEDVVEFDYDGFLCAFDRVRRRTKNPVKFLFAANHRWPVEVAINFVKGKWYGGQRKIMETCELNSSHLIPLTGQFRESKTALSPRLAAILGWVATDGHDRQRGGHREMVIYQSPSKFLDEIISLTGNCGRAPHPETGVVAVPVSCEDSKAISWTYRGKEDLPWVATALSRDAAESMWHAMFKAEGSTSEAGNQNFAQDREKNSAVLEAFQILCLMTGRTANLSTKECNVRKQKYLRVSEGIGYERYKGKIWCPKTKYGTWIMRHEGAVIITGNTYMRKNLPLQMETAIHKPGVLNAQYKPFRQPTPGEDGYTPGYLASGVAIPTGPEKDGNRQYISKLGLPAEEAFERLHFKNGLPDVGATAMDYMGAMNPLIKAPLEQLFDKQFHTQRNLSDLRPSGTASAIGGLFGEDNPQLLGQVMSNSPLTRFFSTADKLADPRKGMLAKLANLASGVRVTDVDVDKQRAIETRDALQKLMAGHPNLSKHTNFYVKPDDVQNLTPEEIELMRLYSTIQDQSKAYAKTQKRIGVR